MGWVIGSTSLCRFNVGNAVTECRRGKAIERTVGSSMVVAQPPLLDHDACFLHGREFFIIETSDAELAVEPLHAAILPKAARFDVGTVREVAHI